jgi:hypothetical protein
VLDTVAQVEVSRLGRFLEGRTRWAEGSHYRHHRGGHELVRVARGVVDDQVEAVGHGAAEFALVLEGPAIVFCSRFGSALPWLGSPFHWHRVAVEERDWPEAASRIESGARLKVQLIEAGDGSVRATRDVVLSLPFTRVLHEAILEQARFSYEPSVERRALANLLRRCPKPGALVANATIRCKVED